MNAATSKEKVAPTRGGMARPHRIALLSLAVRLLLFDRCCAAAGHTVAFACLYGLHARLGFAAALKRDGADLGHDFLASGLSRRDRAVVGRRIGNDVVLVSHS
jgi:hypothetical protein